MINVNLQDNNSIITLTSPGKMPIKSNNGMFMYNSNELLCVAIGSCIGKYIVRWCVHTKLDIRKLENITITMDNNEIIINISHPKDLDIKELIKEIETCEIVNKLSIEVKVLTSINKTSTNNLLKKVSKPCCGD